MPSQQQTLLADHTTLGLGGPARRFVQAGSGSELVDLVCSADAAGDPVLVLAGGSNVVVADSGFDGLVVHVCSRGIDQRGERLVLQAGEPWDEVVAYATSAGLAGIECLSGIPGSSGATPIQNVGAYGASIEDVLVRVRAFDREHGTIVELDRDACAFGYRTSVFKRSPGHYVVAEVELQLERSNESAPIRYAELARRLDVQIGDRAPLASVRAAVLELRRSKGMVIDAADSDSRSAGSFFTNPLLERSDFDALEERIASQLGADVAPPAWPDDAGRVKTSAAWLIERAGFSKGYGSGRAGISTKHTLALVNRGDATTAELLAVAREVRDGVDDAFGIILHPEPVLVGVAL